MASIAVAFNLQDNTFKIPHRKLYANLIGLKVIILNEIEWVTNGLNKKNIFGKN